MGNETSEKEIIGKAVEANKLAQLNMYHTQIDDMDYMNDVQKERVLELLSNIVREYEMIRTMLSYSYIRELENGK